MSAAPQGVLGRSIVRALLRQASAWERDAAAVASRSGSTAAAVAGPTPTSTSSPSPAAVAAPAATPAHPQLAPRAPLAPDAWRVGAHGAALTGAPYHTAALGAILEGCVSGNGGSSGPSPHLLFPPLPPGGAWTGAAHLRAWILEAARLSAFSPSASLDAGLAGLRALQAQRGLERCSSSSTTAGVRVDATAALVAKKEGSGGGGDGLVIDWGSGRGGGARPPAEDEDEAGGARWLFTYRLRITHVGSGNEEAAIDGASSHHPPVQLLTRAWTIRDGRGRLHASVPPGSPGLVGATPTLAPGECFEYYSATDLPSPGGVMKGSFGARWVEEDGSGKEGSGPPARFEVAVAPFALLADPLGVGGRKGKGC